MAVQGRHLHAERRVHALDSLRAAALALVVLAGWSTPAAAQVSVEVSPLRVELEAAPGSTTTQGVTLLNAGAEPVRIRARLSDWDLSRDGSPQFEAAVVDGPYSATRWTRLAPPEIVLEPGREAIVRFSLTIPADARPGGYRTGILFELAPDTGEAFVRSREVTFKSRVATLVYAHVGRPPLDAELTDLVVRSHGVHTQVVASLKNTSRRGVRTRGTMVLRDETGSAVREVPVPDVPLLPESARDIAIAAVDGERYPPLPAGTYRVEVRIDVGLPALLVGETTLRIPR